MKVNESCTGCEECLPYCPQGAIFMTEAALAAVDGELCVECGVCIDSDICPVSAFEEDPGEAAAFKRPFGRLLTKHLDSENVSQAGGYDVKTNDVTGKLPMDKVVMRLELGRPRGGLKFGDMEQMGVEMKRRGWNPALASRSRNIREDALADKVADQRILTGHLEIILAPEKIPEVIKDAVQFVSERDLWVSINVAGVAEMIARTQTVLKDHGVHMEPVAKVNLGLGRRS